MNDFVKWIAGNVLMRLADAAGALAFRIRNSDDVDVLTVDSQGDVNVAGDLSVGGTGPDHGGLGGLGDDDHSQYYNAARHTKAVHDALALDHGALSGKGDDDHTQYLRADGARALTADWDIGDLRKLWADVIRARDGAGLKLQDDGGNGVFIDDGGNVGIGTTAPEGPLHVVSNASPAMVWVVEPTSGSARIYARETSTHALYLYGANPSGAVTLQLNPNSDSFFAGGNLGVGLTNPSVELDVDGAIGIKDGVAAPSTVAGKAFIYVDSVDGDLKVKFGDGTVKVITADT